MMLRLTALVVLLGTIIITCTGNPNAGTANPNATTDNQSTSDQSTTMYQSTTTTVEPLTTTHPFDPQSTSDQSTTTYQSTTTTVEPLTTTHPFDPQSTSDQSTTTYQSTTTTVEPLTTTHPFDPQSTSDQSTTTYQYPTTTVEPLTTRNPFDHQSTSDQSATTYQYPTTTVEPLTTRNPFDHQPSTDQSTTTYQYPTTTVEPLTTTNPFDPQSTSDQSTTTYQSTPTTVEPLTTTHPFDPQSTSDQSTTTYQSTTTTVEPLTTTHPFDHQSTSDQSTTTYQSTTTTVEPLTTTHPFDHQSTSDQSTTTYQSTTTTVEPLATTHPFDPQSTSDQSTTTYQSTTTTVEPLTTTHPFDPQSTSDQSTTTYQSTTTTVEPLTTTNPFDHQSTSDQSTTMYQSTTTTVEPLTTTNPFDHQSTSDQSTTMYQSTTTTVEPLTTTNPFDLQSTSDQSTTMYQYPTTTVEPLTTRNPFDHQSTSDQSTTMYQHPTTTVEPLTTTNPFDHQPSTDQSTAPLQHTPQVESTTTELPTAAPPNFCGGQVDTFEAALECSSSSSNVRRNDSFDDEAPEKLTADEKSALEDFITNIADLPTEQLSKNVTDSIATGVLYAFSKLTEPEQTLSIQNEMEVVSNTEDAMKVLAGTLEPGTCTTLTQQQNSADLCSYQTVDDLKAFEFVQNVETSASSSQDSLDADFSDLLSDDGNFILVVLRKENNLNRTVFLNETETEVAYNETTQEVNSALLTFSLFVEGNKTSVPVAFRLQHIVDTGTKILPIDDTAFYEVIRTPICAFWNEINETWSTRGCKTVFSTTHFSKCDCNHSTNFGILMDISYKETKVLPKNTILRPIDWLSNIGVGVSILALVLQLTIYIYLWRMLQFDRIFIHTNLVVALLVALILFVGGVDRGNGNPVVCKIIALFLHFFYLSVFGWMLVEGVHLYMKVVKVYGSENIKVYRYVLIGWVAPAIICAISFGANNGGYGSKTVCWLVGYSAFLFVVPVIVVVMFNMIVFTMVIRITMKSARLHQEKNYDHIKSGVKGALVLMPIMGMTWLFGLLMFEVFKYLFVIFNSFQGLFIFLIYCVFNSEVRAAFVRKRNKRRQEMALNSRSLPMQSVQISKVTETEFLPDPSIQIEEDGPADQQESENIHKEDIVVSSRTSPPSCSSSMELPGTPSSPPVSVEPVATPEPIESNEPVATLEPIESNEPVTTPEPIEQECLKTPPVSPVEALVLAPCPALKPHKKNINKRPLPKNKVEPWKYW
ncbi:uncharacterized protein [Asterias amurensis]|uniref:uncharacterized protein isoform X2 n=1 Tax=Asterias amurensis TaxID=7602 RepID=UPI003AB30048